MEATEAELAEVIQEEALKLVKKRMCKFPGCSRVIKSQGHCQRHGAKPKRCSVSGCDKQAQGTHAGMCKKHFKVRRSPFSVCASLVKSRRIDPLTYIIRPCILPALKKWKRPPRKSQPQQQSPKHLLTDSPCTMKSFPIPLAIIGLPTPMPPNKSCLWLNFYEMVLRKKMLVGTGMRSARLEDSIRSRVSRRNWKRGSVNWYVCSFVIFSIY